jgi:hypothetical protein
MGEFVNSWGLTTRALRWISSPGPRPFNREWALGKEVIYVGVIYICVVLVGKIEPQLGFMLGADPSMTIVFSAVT